MNRIKFNTIFMNQENTENLNRPRTTNEIKSLRKNFQQTRVLDQMFSQVILPKFQRRVNTHLSQTIPKL